MPESLLIFEYLLLLGMATLYIYFKPSAASKYRIRWRKSTELSFPAANIDIVNKDTINAWNKYEATITNTDVDWVFEVTSICNTDQYGPPRYGIVRATCKGVNFEISYDHCSCGNITGITTTTG